MGEDYGYRDAWPRDPQAPVVAAFHGAIRKLAAERFAATGKPWEEVVHDRSLHLTRQFPLVELHTEAEMLRAEEIQMRKVATELFGFSRRAK